ncbi:AraC family ligand binding domain-containing protein [Klebsiella variicola subsp. variicola]|nr:AraC family ligand binding domain-containing protein [Klebsiella variicola subsp. variicola]
MVNVHAADYGWLALAAKYSILSKIPESGQSYAITFANTLYDPDAASCPAIACHLDFVEYEAEVPVHTHRKGQLIIVLYGAVSCRAENNLWIVPPRCAVWIPGGIPHSVSATWNARASIICLLNPRCRAAWQLLHLALSPLIHELVERLTMRGGGLRGG